jgi:hypothetical protein
VKAGELLEARFDLGLGEVAEERLDFVLENALLREEALLRCPSDGKARCAEVLGLGDIEEALAILQAP